MTLLLGILLALLLREIFRNDLQKIAPHREYKSGTRWGFWLWTKVDSDYIVRLHVFKAPFGAICLHWLKKADAEPWLHDHPVSFLSIILRGGYAEVRKKGDGEPYHKINRWFNFVRGSDKDRHRIVLTRAGTLTLCFMGPKTREWGFHMPEGWVMWKDYYKRLRAGEDMRDVYAKVAVEDEKEVVFVQPVQSDGPPPGASVDFTVARSDFYKKVRIGGEDPDDVP